MVKSKKISIFILMLMLALSSILFVACGKTDYSKTYLSASQTYLELYKDEEKNLTITIENPVENMSRTLKYSLSNPNVCDLEVASQHDMSTTYIVTAKNGGKTAVDFVSIDGSKTISVNILVKEYSSILQAGENSLYISSSSKLAPSSYDFIFDDSSTERELTYYFYGKDNVAGSNLTLEDVTKDELLINNFTEIELYTLEDKFFLIFTDKDGLLHTLGKSTLVAGSDNTTYQFMTVTKTDTGYEFDVANATSVLAGDKFAFITSYDSAITDEPIICEREFTVVIDINKEDVSHEYGYKIEGISYVQGVDGTSYKIDEHKNGEITLIPNYVSVISNPLLTGYNANYLTAYVEISIKNLNEFLKVKTSVKDKTIANSTVLGTYENGDYTVYCIQLNCGIGVQSSTSLDINLYYDGFENNSDEKVNYVYSIPVNIHIKPTKLLVNNVDLTATSSTYRFYNNYASDIFGWQPLNFTIVPEGAEYEKLYIDLNESDLQIRYKNVVYTTGELIIDDLSETVYIKGGNNAALTAENKSLPINLDFNVIQEDTISSYLNYVIVKGPSPLAYKTEAFENKIYVERFGGNVGFDDIYTDAEFASMTFTHISGVDVANISYDSRNPFIQEGTNYKLNLTIAPKATGNGTYTITLDNGEQIPINIEVGESLQSISLSTKDENNVIRLMENVVDGENSSSLIYLYNANGNINFDLTLIANNSTRSNAIEEILPETHSPYISLTQLTDSKSFIVYVTQTGTLSLTFTVQGYEILNFARTSKSIDYRVKIVSFDFIERLNVYKLSDGFGEYASKTSASYANVYSNTYNEDARKIKLEIALQNPEAYLFANPSTNTYIDSTYSSEFLYLESDARIYRDSEDVELMYFSSTKSNIYTLKNNLGELGTFDTETLTFTAFSSLQNSANLKLIAHVKQYGKTYSYTINISIEIYEVVERVTLQNSISELEFSTLEREKALIAYPTNKTATDGKVVTLFVGGEILVDNESYSMFDDSSITYSESDGKTFISLTISQSFLEKAANYEEEMVGDLVIVAKDWLDNGGNLRSEYQELALHIKVRFANGTVKNRFTIEDADDLVAIKDNLSAHYQINTTIDASTITSKLPLGELKGSIVGVNEYAIITNINIANSVVESEANYYGLFTKIAEGAYIEYVQFEGSFNVDYKEGASYIGLLTAENNGRLINVGSKIAASNVYMHYGNFGGLVGTNNGEIIQDFTLFEANNSNTRTTSVAGLTSTGRYSYQNKTPLITVQMTEFVNVTYTVDTNISSISRIGGLVGYNVGLIKKVDSNKVSFNGYSNYMAYSLLKTQPSNDLSKINRLYSYTGGLVGASVSSTTGKIIAGYNLFNDLTSKPDFTIYADYKQDSETNFEAGEGLVVGGEVWAYGYVGGVVGSLTGLSATASTEFAGITSRTFIRGQRAGNTIASMAIIANIEEIKDKGGLSLAFAIQAVDDGKMAEESSMAILYNGSKTDTYSNNVSVSAYTRNLNILGFGPFTRTGNDIEVLNGFTGAVASEGKPINVYTYAISREFIAIPEGSDSVIVINSSKETYYGDFVIVGTQNTDKVVLEQVCFTKGNNENLSLSPKFNNLMTTTGSNSKDVFYAYYFQAASAGNDSDLSSVQIILDTYLNKVSASSELYPFVANGEMVFTSSTPDVLTIDQMGKLTIKKTGLALISASSVLNSNNALNFYIYVVNYFNSESTLTAEERGSIIYNDSSASSVPVNESNIELRGNNSAEIYVRPKYNLNFIVEEGVEFASDKYGKVTFRGIAFNLAENTAVTAKVEEETNSLEINVTGQTINIRKKSDTVQGTYPLTLTPVLSLVIESEKGSNEYIAEVNKKIVQTKINYKYGALSLTNKNYNTVPIQTSKSVNDTIIINTTDVNETAPLYYIVGLDRQTIQGTVSDIEYTLEEENFLFNIIFDESASEINDVGNGIYEIKYGIDISINTESQVYTERYNKEIYGSYLLYIQPSSNSSLSICIKVEFERTEISTIIIDNYKSISDMGGSGLSTTSDYAYPGEEGLLAITISPEDSDFDYILIENDEENYTSGKASISFSLASRKLQAEGNDGTGLFASNKIIGSSTAKGIKLTQDEIIDAYARTDKEGDKEIKYYTYNGVIYIKYSMSSKNVTDLSTSRINIKLYKAKTCFPTYKNLKVKLQNFVAIELADKTDGISNQNGYYMSYDVARGMKYKLKLSSFGFRQENIDIISTNTSLGQITYENGNYYLTITENIVSYTGSNNEFEIKVEAAQSEGENLRQAESKTKITVFEYVLNYNNLLNSDADIVTGAGNGVINVQVGSQINLAIDMFDFVEYNSSIASVVNNVQKFFDNLSEKGNWYSFTNLLSDDQPDYSQAPNYDLNDIENIDIQNSSRKIYTINSTNSNKNYYFKNEGLKVMPLRTHIPEDKFYYFGFVGKYKESNGVYVYDKDGTFTVTTTFTLNVYTTSSEESPIPVYDYDDFKNMQSGGYYILLNDITLPNATDEATGVTAFTPLDGQFASLDGNGHTINFAGTYDMGNASEIGIFSNLNEGSIIKNLIVNYTASNDGSDLNTNANDTTYGLYGLRTVKFITTADSFVFGSIVAENSGIITNCQVYTDTVNNTDYYLTVKADYALQGSSYIGGLVGRNSGFITNCGVSINVKSPYNIGGVVAQNYNKIAGCYFKEGKLINNSQFAQYVGGFAVSNSLDSQIITSYVAGVQSNANLYSQDSNSYITSTIAAAGFIYENLGNINDCYSDIDLSKTTSEMAGFVYKNSGQVKNSFSLSKLRNNTTASAGFVKENTSSSASAFVNCYYYYHNKVDANDLEGNINTSLYDTNFEGVEKLNREQFANFDEYFSDYSYEQGMGVNSVWFVASGQTSSNYVEYIPTTQKIVIEGEDGNTQSNTVYKTEIMNFGLNRLELVSPNVRVLSVKNFAYSDMDEATGNVTYFYNDDTSTPNRGSLHNPRLIYSATSMENEILNETATTNINSTNYRLISDVSYSEFEGHSSLYKVKFAGILEGNGMKVSGISLVSMDNLSSAGLFSQIGYSASKQGSVKNLTISPRAVSFNNTNSVGILAGTIKYGYVYDVTTEAVQGSSSTVTGLKFVGGIFGRAVTSFTIKDVYSSANVAANHSPALDVPYVEGDANEGGEYSYAGSIAGFVGKGKLYNAHVTNVSSVMGGRVGFAYGGVGRGAEVKYTFIDVVPASTIKPYQYGGYVAGEVSGNLTYSYVSNNGNDEYTFSNIPKVATAVGGIAGRFNGGLISNALIEQNFSCNVTESNQTISYVGGIVGLISSTDYTVSKIQDCVVNANISAGSTLGGGVGRIMTATQIDNIAIKSLKLSISGQRANPCLGGIVGSLTNNSGSSLEMSNSYCNADIEIKTNTSGVQSTAYAGGLIADAKITPRLYYCYTTSSIYAEVYDSRQVSGLVDFSDIRSQTEYRHVVSYEHKLYGKTSENSSATFTSSYNGVYYFGKDVNSQEKYEQYVEGESTPASLRIYDKNYVTFKTKAKSVDIKLAVSNFGTPITALSGTTKSTLNNIYAKNYQLLTDDTTTPVLELKKMDTSSFESLLGTFTKNETNIYYAYKDITTTPDGPEDLSEVGEYDLKTYYMVNDDQFEYSYKSSQVSGGTSTTDYYLKLVGSNTTYTWDSVLKAFVLKNGNEVVDKIFLSPQTTSTSDDKTTDKHLTQLRYEFTESSLFNKAVYKGDDGNYYLKSLTGINTTTDERTYDIKDIKKAESAQTTVKLSETPVWKDDPTQLSVLYIESQFDWISKA